MKIFSGSATKFSWADIQDTVVAFSLTGKAAAAAEARWVSDTFPGHVLRKDLELDYKKEILDAKLIALGLGPLTTTVSDKYGNLVVYDYSTDDAQARRLDNLNGLTHRNPKTGASTLFPGMLLPGD